MKQLKRLEIDTPINIIDCIVQHCLKCSACLKRIWLIKRVSDENLHQRY